MRSGQSDSKPGRATDSVTQPWSAPMACTSQLPHDDRMTRCCSASNRIASRRAVETKIGTGMRRNPPAGARANWREAAIRRCCDSPVPSTSKCMATFVALGADLDGQMTCKFSSAKERRGCRYTLLRSSRSSRSITAFGWSASRRTSAMALDTLVFPEPGVRVGPAPRRKARPQCSDGT